MQEYKRLTTKQRGDTLKPINILVTLNENYMPQLNVMLSSMRINNPGEKFDIYLMHRGISKKRLAETEIAMEKFGYGFFPILIDENVFTDVPTGKLYPQEMYYRLCAPKLLPDNIDKIIYLDPDLLIINPLRPLWDMDMGSNIFAAASHTGKTDLSNSVNKLRLGTATKYYNSGVLLMNLPMARREVSPEEIFKFARNHSRELILPDQDILNILYGNKILEINDFIWNYDARNYSNYLLRSGGVSDADWVMRNTAILHFCGKTKPWKDIYRHRFGLLYKHYMQISSRFFA